MNEISVLIVEDDVDACDSFIECAYELDNIVILKTSNNINEAIQFVTTHLPDVVILDLELHKGSGNGLEFLKELHNISLNRYPYILVTTNNSSKVTLEYARELGADFIMSKHQEAYSEKSVLEFILMIKDAIIHKTSISGSSVITNETPEKYAKRLNLRIISELNLIGMNPKLKGYTYLIEAINITFNTPVNNLCHIIGQKYKASDSSVERAMQNALNSTWRTGNIVALAKHYTAKISSEKGVPTITEFVSYYARKIANQM